MRTTPRAAIAGIVALALLVGGAHTAIAAPEQDPAVVGDAATIEAGVEVRSGAVAPYEALADIKPVAVGDGVRTDDTGYAEISYFDGSKTRLDVDTEFEVVELVNDAGVSSTRTSMGVGRTWNRVEQLGEGEFTVETSQATATVRGTAFVLDCASATSCTYLVVEGIVELTLPDGSVVVVVGPAQVDVVDGVAGPVTPVSLEQVLADPWLADNIVRDVAAGFFDLRDGAVTTTTGVTIEPTTTVPEPTTTVPEPTSTEPGSTTTEPGSTSTELESTTSTEPEPTTSSTTEPEPTTSSTTEPQPTTSSTSEPQPTTEPKETTSSTTTTTQPRETPTSSTTLPETTTTTTSTTTTVPDSERVPLCHWTGDQYQLLLVDINGALTHLVQHAPFDFIPIFTGRCPAPAQAATAAALVATTSLPTTTTTTTEPLEAATTAAATTTIAPDTTASVPMSTAAPATQAVRASTVTTAVSTEAPPRSSSAPATTATSAATEPAATEAAAEPTTSAPEEPVADADLTSTSTEPPATTAARPPAAELPTGWGGRRFWQGVLAD